MKATDQYFPVVLFIMLYKVVLTFESADEILKCDHSNKSFRAVLLPFIMLCQMFSMLESEVKILNHDKCWLELPWYGGCLSVGFSIYQISVGFF